MNETFPVPMPQGFRWSGVRCGLKNKRNDVGILLSDRPARAAGVFTSNLVHASCVDYSREVLSNGLLRAIAVNSGNANCCTGEKGEEDTRLMASLAAECLELDPTDVAVASTGVIGNLLDMAKLEAGIRNASMALGENPRPFMDAILTTDLIEKWAWSGQGSLISRLESRGANPSGNSGPCTFGVAKGSGMIAPNLATMLCFVVSDFDVTDVDLQSALMDAVNVSFNCTTVDSDASTNDMVLLMANGASGVRATRKEFVQTLSEVLVSLAKQVAKDGEGATKLVEVRVTGSDDPKRAARAIAESPLVKTALFGCDPNWGRILAAAGRSGASFDPRGAALWIESETGRFQLYGEGGPCAYDPKEVSAALKTHQVLIDLVLGSGDVATIYTCDFGYGYVRINAEYHT